MRQFLILLLVLNPAWVFGQGFSYPIIKSEGKVASNFIPNGWKVKDSVSGDLNNDKINDLVLIIQHKDNVKLALDDEFAGPVVTQPRILVILFRDQSTQKLWVVEQSNSFILNDDNPNSEDPYQSIKIDKGILQINFQLFYNTGSWIINNSSYKFRYNERRFVFISAENNSFNRASHAFESYSYNFLTKQWQLSKGKGSLEKLTTKWHKLEIRELKTFQTFKKPYSWEIAKDTYL